MLDKWPDPNDTDIFWSCFQYDANMLLALSLDFMVRLGIEYEDFQTAREQIRLQRFTGCTGFMTFSKTTNDRDLSNHAINNV
jgi:hypothetical protein